MLMSKAVNLYLYNTIDSEPQQATSIACLGHFLARVQKVCSNYRIAILYRAKPHKPNATVHVMNETFNLLCVSYVHACDQKSSEHLMIYLKNARRKHLDRLADSCKLSSVNRMAAGSSHGFFLLSPTFQICFVQSS